MLEIKSLGKTYGTGQKETRAIQDVSFSVDDREFVCVVGPSGCGKTTLLKCMAGLLRPTDGEVLLHGRRVTGPPEEMALVFQEYGRSLMPWTSVRNNVLLPLRHKKLAARGAGPPRRGGARRGGPRRASPTTTHGSCQAACNNASRSHARSPTSPRSCSWTSRSHQSTPKPAPTSKTSCSKYAKNSASRSSSSPTT